MIAKSLDFGLTREGVLKIGETELPPIGGDPPTSDASPSSPVAKWRRTRLPIPDWIRDPFEVMFTLRGIGWNFGRDAHIAQETRPLERGAFLRSTLLMLVKKYLLFDLLEVVAKSIPGVGTPEGGSMFFPQLPVATRYAVSTAIHIGVGLVLLAAFDVGYYLITLIAVGLLGQSPLSWPPILNNPWLADSLNDFWTKRWHQLLRRTFVVYGGYPGSWLTGGSRVGKVLGAFLASGLFHELSIYTLGKGLDHNITLFFVWQAIGVILEKMWKDVTGYRVRGWAGLVWVYFSIVVVGQPCSELLYTYMRFFIAFFFSCVFVFQKSMHGFLEDLPGVISYHPL
jgi:Membrane bound O-acyl transferase family